MENSKLMNEEGVTTPVEKQIAFLKKVMFDADEYDKFLADPEGYSSRQEPAVTVEFEVAEKVQQYLMYDVAIDTGFAEKSGKNGQNLNRTIEGLQTPNACSMIATWRDNTLQNYRAAS